MLAYCELKGLHSSLQLLHLLLDIKSVPRPIIFALIISSVILRLAAFVLLTTRYSVVFSIVTSSKCFNISLSELCTHT